MYDSSRVCMYDSSRDCMYDSSRDCVYDAAPCPVPGVAPERRSELEDLTERYLTTRLYRVLFTPLSQQLEDADLAVQKRIRSLYWVGTELLELNIDETNPAVTELVEQAITGAALTGSGAVYVSK